MKEQENVLPTGPERSPSPPMSIPVPPPEGDDVIDISDEPTERACKCTSCPYQNAPLYSFELASPLDMADIEVQLDASFSTKIQVTGVYPMLRGRLLTLYVQVNMREETYSRLYGALQKIFATRDADSIWTKLSKKPMSAVIK